MRCKHLLAELTPIALRVLIDDMSLLVSAEARLTLVEMYLVASWDGVLNHR